MLPKKTKGKKHNDSKSIATPAGKKAVANAIKKTRLRQRALMKQQKQKKPRTKVTPRQRQRQRVSGGRRRRITTGKRPTVARSAGNKPVTKLVKKALPARGNHESNHDDDDDESNHDKLKESRGASDPWAYLDSLPDQAFKAAGVAQGFKLANPMPDTA